MRRAFLRSFRLPPQALRRAARAHEICVTRGGEQGRVLEDWPQAEREIVL
jgi:hypothetical protein